MRIAVAICVFYLYWCTSFSYSQELTPVFENITDGLPSTEVHDMFQDSIGYMWFATDRGICKYNGDRFQQIEVESYLKTKVVFKFFKQKENKIWIVSGKKRLYWFNPFESKPKFYGHKYNDQLESILVNSRFERNISEVHFIKTNILITFRTAPGYILIDEKTGCVLIDGQENVKVSQIYSTNILIKNIQKINYLQLKKNLSNHSNNFLEYYSQQLPLPKLGNINLNFEFGISCELNTKDGGKYLAIANLFIQNLNGKIKSLNLPSSILCMTLSKNGFLVGTYDGIYLINSNFEIKGKFLQENSITRIFKDNSNYYWIATLQNGVYLVRNFSTFQFTFQNHFTTSYILTRSNKILLYDKVKKGAKLLNENEQILGEYNDILITQSKIRFKKKIIINALNLKRKYFSLDENILKEQYFEFFHDNLNTDNYFVQTGAIWKNTINGIELFFRNNAPNKIKFCFQINQKQLLVGTENGCYFLTISTKNMDVKAIGNSDQLSFNAYLKIDDKIIFATDKGFYLLYKSIFKKVDETINENISGLYRSNEKDVWAFSDNHIYKINIIPKIPIISEYMYDFGVKNSVIVSLVEIHNKLWVATKNGLFITDLNDKYQNSSQTNFKFELDSIQIGNQTIKNHKKINIYSEENIQLFFSTISYDRKLDRALEYSIDGESWFETNKKSIMISDLPFGENTIIIRRVEDPTKIIFKIPIIVSKHFYETIWFKSLIFIFLVLMISLIGAKIFKHREAKKSEELEKLSLELKLLTSKMNPHFTFNTINSIQHYILKHDKKEAINYLSEFALLMRKSLDFSMEERINLKQEKEFIELYVHLENKRFNSNFKLDFQVNTPRKLLTHKIPSMLIQPLIENVILHANYKPEDEKWIKITIELEKGYYTIKVIDYGVGMQIKNELKEHKSYGLEIITSRVKLYNGKDYSEEDILIASTNEKTKKGTTITLKLKEWIQ